jgi:hypothetical protein
MGSNFQETSNFYLFHHVYTTYGSQTVTYPMDNTDLIQAANQPQWMELAHVCIQWQVLVLPHLSSKIYIHRLVSFERRVLLYFGKYCRAMGPGVA